jgi:hypothetical protein
MSKLPRIASNRSSNKNTEVESLNGLQSPQTNEIIEEQHNLILPNINQENDIIKNPLVINTKINQLETKLLTLEKNYESVLNIYKYIFILFIISNFFIVNILRLIK